LNLNNKIGFAETAGATVAQPWGEGCSKLAVLLPARLCVSQSWTFSHVGRGTRRQAFFHDTSSTHERYGAGIPKMTCYIHFILQTFSTLAGSPYNDQ